MISFLYKSGKRYCSHWVFTKLFTINRQKKTLNRLFETATSTIYCFDEKRNKEKISIENSWNVRAVGCIGGCHRNNSNSNLKQNNNLTQNTSEI